MTLVLIGLRGSGKSTIGRAAGAALGWAFVDLDDLTPGVLGAASAGEALKTHGEAAFRDAEATALAGVLAAAEKNAGRVVIALGGGTPTAPGVPELLRGAGARAVYLRATPRTLRERLVHTDLRTRPSLTGRGVLAEIAAVFERRDGVYSALAAELGTVIDVDGLSAHDLERAVVDIARG